MTVEQLQDVIWVYGLIAMLAHKKTSPQADEAKVVKAFDELHDYVWNNREMLGDGNKGIVGDFTLNGGDGRKMVVTLSIALGE